MRPRRFAALASEVRLACVAALIFGRLTAAIAAPPAAPPQACKRVVIPGELNAGQPFTRPIGGGLEIYLQPIASGWILRVLPITGPTGDHDYAELATPPYQSVTPLSISTDFAFRAQDAIGWNPRRFRFATSEADFHRLDEAYLRFEQAGATPPATLQVELSSQIARSSEGTFTILDSRLIPGVADQWKMAGAVASHFNTTAHTLVDPPDGKVMPLGRILWLRFKLELNLPAGFAIASGLTALPQKCGTPESNLLRHPGIHANDAKTPTHEN